jgi:penicillin-binding protein 2
MPTVPPPAQTNRNDTSRLLLFYVLIAGLLLILVGGMAWQQLFRTDEYHVREQNQSQRRIVVPGSRGNIFDRNGELLVGNTPRFAVTLALDELHREFRDTYIGISKKYRAEAAADSEAGKGGPKDEVTVAQLEQIARASVARDYLDKVNKILQRATPIELDAEALERHFNQEQLLPYLLANDLTDEEYARLLEQLPVKSPLQVYAVGTRYYPHGALAAQTLGTIRLESEVDAPKATIKVAGTKGRDGLEKAFDALLQGKPGSTLFRVNPAGYRINPPLENQPPVRGGDLTCSLDLKLQAAAEAALGDKTGAAVALDVKTGEVLAMACEPGYDLSAFSPHLSQAAYDDIESRQAWSNRSIDSFHPPGSTFKLVVSIAALRLGTVKPDDEIADCTGSMTIGNQVFTCDNGKGHHGALTMSEAIAQSCDIYFYTAGLLTSAPAIAHEAKRFHLDRPMGLELPESNRALIPDPETKKRLHPQQGGWAQGDTAYMSIGQGDVLESPINMACFAASLARDEVYTKPTLIHRANAPEQHSEPIGLTPEQRATLLDGMLGCTTHGTAAILTTHADLAIPGLNIAGKTGTAQLRGRNEATQDAAWFICFAPLEHPRIAIAVMIEGESGEATGGGAVAAPVADKILKEWWQSQPESQAAAATAPAAP